MSETLEITTEQINDLPLLLGLMEEMSIRTLIDAQIRPHGGWQGISVGTVVSIWLCHVLILFLTHICGGLAVGRRPGTSR